MAASIRRHPLVWFFLLAYLLSWVVWTPLIVVDLGETATTSIMLVGVLGPMGAAMIVAGATGTSRLLWRSTLRWRVRPVWYLAAIAIPLLVLAAVRLVAWRWGVEDPSSPVLVEADEPLVLYPLVLLFMIVIGGGMEEPGWRGFAQIRLLRRFSPLLASVVLGLIWTAWHAPLFLVPGSSQQGIEVGWYTAAIVAMSVTLTWMFIRSGGSALLAIVFHGGVNAINSWIPPFVVPIGSTQLSGFAVLESIHVLVGLVVLVGCRRWFLARLPDDDPLFELAPPPTAAPTAAG